jgi:hypothetical protein
MSPRDREKEAFCPTLDGETPRGDPAFVGKMPCDRVLVGNVHKGLHVAVNGAIHTLHWLAAPAAPPRPTPARRASRAAVRMPHIRMRMRMRALDRGRAYRNMRRDGGHGRIARIARITGITRIAPSTPPLPLGAPSTHADRGLNVAHLREKVSHSATCLKGEPRGLFRCSASGEPARFERGFGACRPSP